VLPLPASRHPAWRQGAHVCMHGARADHQAPSYVVVAQSDRDQSQHLHLALGQPGRPPAQRLGQLRECMVVCSYRWTCLIRVVDGASPRSRWHHQIGCCDHRGGPRTNPHLAVDRTQMSVDGPRAQHELLGDLEVGEAGSHQPQDLRLAERQPRRADPQVAAELGQLLPGEPHRVIRREGKARLVRLQPGGLPELSASHIGQAESGVDGIPGNLVVFGVPAGRGAVQVGGTRPPAQLDTLPGDNLEQVGRRRQQPMPALIVQRPGTRVHRFDPLPTQLVGQRETDLGVASAERALPGGEIGGGLASRATASDGSPAMRAASPMVSRHHAAPCKSPQARLRARLSRQSRRQP
jgi:hypothetical protein